MLYGRLDVLRLVLTAMRAVVRPRQDLVLENSDVRHNCPMMLRVELRNTFCPEIGR
jgi:hypothetical protein